MMKTAMKNLGRNLALSLVTMPLDEHFLDAYWVSTKRIEFMEIDWADISTYLFVFFILFFYLMCAAIVVMACFIVAVSVYGAIFGGVFYPLVGVFWLAGMVWTGRKVAAEKWWGFEDRDGNESRVPLGIMAWPITVPITLYNQRKRANGLNDDD